MNAFQANQKAEYYGGIIATLLVLVPVVIVIIFVIVCWIGAAIHG